MTEIELINAKLKAYKNTGLEGKIYSIKRTTIVIGYSDDLTYGHDFSIEFKSSYALQMQLNWFVNEEFKIIEELEYNNESMDFADKLNIIADNKLYKIYNADNKPFFIAAEAVKLIDAPENYY